MFLIFKMTYSNSQHNYLPQANSYQLLAFEVKPTKFSYCHGLLKLHNRFQLYLTYNMEYHKNGIALQINRSHWVRNQFWRSIAIFQLLHCWEATRSFINFSVIEWGGNQVLISKPISSISIGFDAKTKIWFH